MQITFTQHIIASNYDGASSVHATDVNDDGNMDIMGCAFYGDELTLWINPGDTLTGWSPTILDDNFDGAHFVNIGDLDHDGDLDIVAVAQLGGDVAWWRNDSLSYSWSEVIIKSGFAGAHEVRTGDFAWWSNDGGTPIFWTQYTFETNFAEAWPILAYDIDSDTDLDILVGGRAIDRISWYKSSKVSGLKSKTVPKTPQIKIILIHLIREQL